MVPFLRFFGTQKGAKTFGWFFGKNHSTCEMLKQMNAERGDAVLLNACEGIQARNVHVTGENFSCSIANKILDVKLLQPPPFITLQRWTSGGYV